MIHLILPNRDYEASYRTFLAEYSDEPYIPYSLNHPCDDFDKLLALLDDQSKGIGLPEGWVPITPFWLVDGETVLGVADLRHKLTDELLYLGGHIGYSIRKSVRKRGYGKEILRLTLKEASKMGIYDVYITCDKNNIASVKIILANGGEFDSETYDSDRNDYIQRYWIRLSSNVT